jgi:hypothetical protein
MPGEPLGPFPDRFTESDQLTKCKEWIKTYGSDPDEPLSLELAPRVLEATKETWAFLLQEHFPRRGPTVFA